MPSTASRSLTHAAYTPEVELLAPNWPPEPDETGSGGAGPRPGQLSALLQDLVRAPRDERGEAWAQALVGRADPEAGTERAARREWTRRVEREGWDE